MKTTEHKRIIHCDSCGYEIIVTNNDLKSYIGKKCPKCGAVMLTNWDYEECKKLDKILGYIPTNQKDETQIGTIEIDIKNNN